MLWGYGRLFRWVPIILGCLARNWKIFHVDALLLFLKKEQCLCDLLHPPIFWERDPSYRGSHEDIARQIVDEWKINKLVPDHDGLWFCLPGDCTT